MDEMVDLLVYEIVGQAVPGDGPVLGVVRYSGNTYVIRASDGVPIAYFAHSSGHWERIAAANILGCV